MKWIERIKDIKHYYDAYKVLKMDVKQYIRFYSSLFLSNVKGLTARRDILVYCHVVEKGLSHKNLKPLFGYDRVSLLASKLQEYVNKDGTDTYVVNLAISTIKKYNEVNKNMGVNLEQLILVPDINFDFLDVGTDTVSKADYFKNASFDFEAFSKSRHSIRLYDYQSDVIMDEEILECIENAQSCPSACNRQAVRIKLVKDREKIKDICDIQGGSKGFGENSGVILVITVDISLYEPHERRIPMLDCGIFVMNLIYSLYAHCLGSCILNGSFTQDKEEKIRNIVPIQPNEMLAVVLSVSKIPDGKSINIPKSCRRKVTDIISQF